MNARQLIEQLCRVGDNVWQTGYIQLHGATIGPLLEAWSADRKAEIVRKNTEKGNELIDHVTLGDYDLTLWRVPVDPKQVYHAENGFIFAAAINNDDHDPTDFQTQVTKFPGSSLRHAPVSSVVDVLRRWVQDHKRVAVGTINARKNAIYRRLLTKYFTISDLMPEAARGFYVE